MDLGKVHGAIIREKNDPSDGYEPIPLWMVAFFLSLTLYCGYYLGANSGGFRADVYNPTQIAYGNIKAAGPAVKDPIAEGKKLFTQNCSVCHQATGLGIPGQYPPLDGSEIVVGKEGFGANHLALIVLKGLSGPATIKGASYNGNMQAWEANFKDEQIANILTFIRNSWSNKVDPITPEYVASLRAKYADRKQPWSFQELKALKAESPPAAAAPPGGAAPVPAPAAPKKS